MRKWSFGGISLSNSILLVYNVVDILITLVELEISKKIDQFTIKRMHSKLQKKWPIAKLPIEVLAMKKKKKEKKTFNWGSSFVLFKWAFLETWSF